MTLPPEPPSEPSPPVPPTPGPDAGQANWPPTAEHPSAVPQKANRWAIASLVTGAFGAVLLSVISGIVALIQIKRGGQRGREMAIAGLILSALWTAGFIALLVVLLPGGSGTVAGNQLKVGDCFETSPYAELPVEEKLVACSQTHEAEVVAVYPLPAGPYPGEEAVGKKRELCREGPSQGWAPHWPASVDVGDLRAGSLYPTKQSWEHGDRTIVCIAFLIPQWMRR